ncbi:MAG TPA: sodium-dependent bicarbonate transport family permease [Casimicrobiaceae bacterium]|nr:sodium-dependent bicarbonate transport family permease [Casimicrobiaceae bacterium]
MQSILDPAILFFVFGAAAGVARSNLEIPPQVSRFLSLYLLMALGLKGGFALAKSGLTSEVALSLGCALALAVVVPAIGYQVLRRLVSGFDAAAIAATYGSVSAVTFITAGQYLDGRGVVYGGHMAAALALMESPAIIMAVFLANAMRRPRADSVAASLRSGVAVAVPGPAPGAGASVGKILHESFTDGAQLLLLGSMAIGLATGEAGKAVMQPFTGDLFRGMLAFFLLDMGLTAARNFGELRGKPPALLAYAVIGPVTHAALALALAVLAGLSPGNGALLMVLAASASYIAVPAVLRYAIPEANPSLYFGMSLGVTFPLNILLGIPFYTSVANAVLG